MVRSLVFLVSILLLCGVTVQAKEPIRFIDGVVVKVSDGDTISVMDNGGTKVKVRLYGIDCPETTKGNKRTGKISKPGQPFGEEASQALFRKVYNKNVRLSVMAVDQYRRLVSLVFIGDRDINREMVAEGWAWAYRHYLDRPYSSDFIEVENSARVARKGLWQQSNPQPPWEFRRLLKRRVVD